MWSGIFQLNDNRSIEVDSRENGLMDDLSPSIIVDSNAEFVADYDDEEEEIIINKLMKLEHLSLAFFQGQSNQNPRSCQASWTIFY